MSGRLMSSTMSADVLLGGGQRLGARGRFDHLESAGPQDARGGIQRRGIVVDHHDLLVGDLVGGYGVHATTCAPCAAARFIGSTTEKRDPLPSSLSRVHLATEQFGELACQRQSEPRAAQALLQAHIELHEVREQIGHVFGRDADARVGDRELHAIARQQCAP